LNASALRIVASTTLIALLVLCLAWELWLAPLRPGGSWLALKALPLVVPLTGILNGRLYTYRWATMLVLGYFTEGAVRAWGDTGLSAHLAIVEVVLSVVLYVTAIAFVRAVTRPRSPRE
jgi:uncharacterized membrane protein